MMGTDLKPSIRQAVFENMPKLIAVSFVYILIVALLSELQFRLPGMTNAYQIYMERVAWGEPHSIVMLLSNISMLGVAMAVLMSLVFPVFHVGYMNYCLRLSREQSGSFKDIFIGMRFLYKVLLIFIITTALVLLWSLLLIVPGVIAHYRYRQAYYILLDDPGKSAIQCIRESTHLMTRNKLDLFLLDVSFLGWHVLSMIFIALMWYFVPFSLPVLSLWISPYTGLTYAAYYDYLLYEHAA